MLLSYDTYTPLVIRVSHNDIDNSIYDGTPLSYSHIAFSFTSTTNVIYKYHILFTVILPCDFKARLADKSGLPGFPHRKTFIPTRFALK